MTPTPDSVNLLQILLLLGASFVGAWGIRFVLQEWLDDIRRQRHASALESLDDLPDIMGFTPSWYREETRRALDG